jgi:hypothetical protein
MCTVVGVAAVVSAVAAVAGTGVAIAGQVEAADAAEDRADYEQQIANYNAALEKQSSKYKNLKEDLAQRQEYGRANLAASAASSDLGFGSTEKAFVQIRKFHALDGVARARDAQIRVLGHQMQGEAAQYNGKVASNNFKFAAGAEGLRGVANVGSIVNSFYKSGVLSGPGSAGATQLVENSPTAQRQQDFGEAYFNPFEVA